MGTHRAHYRAALQDSDDDGDDIATATTQRMLVRHRSDDITEESLFFVAGASQNYHTTRAEITDITSRLAALQSYFNEAKAT